MALRLDGVIADGPEEYKNNVAQLVIDPTLKLSHAHVVPYSENDQVALVFTEMKATQL